MFNVPRGQKTQHVKSVECCGKAPFSKNKSKVTKTFLFFSDTCLLYKNWDALSVLVSLCQLYVTLPKQPYIMVSKIFIFRCASISRIEHGDR